MRYTLLFLILFTSMAALLLWLGLRYLAEPPPIFAAEPDAAIDLVIRKNASPNPVAAGQNLTYTIIVTNTGPVSAQNLLIQDVLPPNAFSQLVATIFVQKGTGSQVLLSSSRITGTVATLHVGGVATLIIGARVRTNVSGATLVNHASVTVTNEMQPGNNQVSIVTNLLTVTPTQTLTPTPTRTPVPTPTGTRFLTTTAELIISKHSAPTQVAPGQPLTYTILITNMGPATANHLLVEDTLPTHVAFQGNSDVKVSKGAGVDLGISGATLTVTLSELRAGGIMTITARTRVGAGASGAAINNRASVTALNEANPANNSASVTTGLKSTPTATATPTATTDPNATHTPRSTPSATVDPNATPTPTATKAQIYLPVVSSP
jgi:uncharacterized repeat protein (TIGR01451 family)